MAIEDFTEDALKAELQRRKKKNVDLPKPNPNPDWRPLLETMATGIEYMVNEGYEEDDLRAYMAEAAWMAAYGQAFYEWKKARGIDRC